VLDNLVGGVLVIAATLLAIGYSHWASRNGEAAEADDEVTPLVQPSPL
jgi:hypothetical protein